jgi:TatD DNase family protein
MEWFDSHCHLQDAFAEGEEAEADREARVHASLMRAAEAAVTRMVCVGTGPETSRQALELARASAARAGEGDELPRMWATIGQHPHEASDGTDEVEALIDAACQAGDGALVAVGECGLDYHYEHSPRAAQREAFAAQVALAHRYQLALVIHARDAWDDLFDVLSVERVPERTVLHCFTGGVAEMRRCVDAGMYVSFSGIVTFKNASDVREAAQQCPLDRLLVETDAPFLAPVPHRGRPNEPSLVPFVGTAIAELRGLAPDEVAQRSAAAAASVFAI